MLSPSHGGPLVSLNGANQAPGHFHKPPPGVTRRRQCCRAALLLALLTDTIQDVERVMATSDATVDPALITNATVWVAAARALLAPPSARRDERILRARRRG